MRQIELRAWDTINNRMIEHWKLFSYSEYLPYLLDFFGVHGIEAQKNCPLIFTEFTGLHDKHKKEIYEGDVVKWFINGLVKQGEVVFDMGMFTLEDRRNLLQSLGNDWYRGEYEIIGNIYENPELNTTESGTGA